MEELLSFKHLQKLITPVSSDTPCGENLDTKGDEEYTRIERDVSDVNNKNESRDWKALKKDIQEILLTTKDFRLVAHYSKTLLLTDVSPIGGLAQGLYLTYEYINKYWDCIYPPEDKDDPDDRYIDRINAIAELGSWKYIVLPLRKKCSLLSFEGFGEFTLEDLVTIKNGDTIEGKQSPKNFIESLSIEEKQKIDDSLNSFKTALELSNKIKSLLLEKTEVAFLDFDAYLLPNLQDGISALSNISPNTEEIITNQKEIGTTEQKNTSQENISSIQSRDDVIKLLEMICSYYAEKEPSSPLPLLLQRAKSIVHKDFLEVLEELVPDSISMIEPVFGKLEEKEN